MSEHEVSVYAQDGALLAKGTLLDTESAVTVILPKFDISCLSGGVILEWAMD